MMIVKGKPQLNWIMKQRGITQKELTGLSGVPQPFISRFDKAEQYNIHNLLSIAKALNVSVEELFIVEDES